jgi:hypothetical protein
MRMAWWIFIAFLSVQIIFIQYMVEVYLAGHYHELSYYLQAMGFVFVSSVLTYIFFRKTDRVND